MSGQARNPVITIFRLTTFVGAIIVAYLIINGYRIVPDNGFFSISFWPILFVLWLLAPRATPFLWLVSIPASILQWLSYIFFGCIVVPRMTWGLIILWYFPASDRTLGLIILVLGLFIDAIEDKIIVDALKTDGRSAGYL